MEIMIRVIIILCVILSLISLSHSAAQEVLGKTVSHDDQGTDNKQEQIEFPVNPRKLKLTNNVANVKNYGENSHPTPVSKQEVALSGKRHERAGKVGRHGNRKGTRQEWMERGTSEFYTMDYHWVKRRRPIHNKSFPFRNP